MLTKGKGHTNTTNLFALPLINHLVPEPIPQPDTSASHPHSPHIPATEFFIPTPTPEKHPCLAPLNPFKPIMSRPTKSLNLIGQRNGNHGHMKEAKRTDTPFGLFFYCLEMKTFLN